jgi:hypothetical protein
VIAGDWSGYTVSNAGDVNGGFISTNNQIIQAIAIDIACTGD